MTEPTKVCPVCNERKPWSSFYPAARNPDGTTLRPRYSCKPCENRATVERTRRRREALSSEERDDYRRKNREYMRTYLADADRRKRRREREAERRRERRRTDPEFLQRERELHRAYYWRVQDDPHRKERMLEQNRLSYRLRRERAGADVRTAPVTSIRPEPDPFLPAAPFAAWLREEMDRHEQRFHEPLTSVILGESIGASGDFVRQLIQGDAQKVRLSLVDRALVRRGVPWLLHDLYPMDDDHAEDEEEAAA